MHQVARHAAYNIVGQGVPVVAGVLAMPIITRALGDARFGLLGLMWAIIGYFSLLDLGLGRATTKFVAEALAAHDARRAQQVAGFTAAGQTALGILGGVALAALAPWLVSGLLRVPPELRVEAEQAFRWLALSVPFVVLSLNLRAVLEGAQRFDLANAIRAPSGVLGFAVPAVAASFGVGLPGIVALLLALRVVACSATWIVIRLALPGFRWELRPTRELVRPLLGYGGWVAVSNVVGPVLTYLERFVLGAVVGVGAVAYFAAPYEAVSRLLILPASLAGGLFPVVSIRLADDRRAEAERLLGRSVRSLWVLLGAPAIVVMVFSGTLLRVWLGPAYAAQGATALAILAAGMLIIGLAHVPSVFLYGQGRPDLPAIFQVFELPIYVALAWWCVRAYGVTGAALAWTLRVTLDAVLLFAAARMIGRFRLRSLLGLSVAR
jgi:O-antigen/teichoic acid export membrane protein